MNISRNWLKNVCRLSLLSAVFLVTGFQGESAHAEIIDLTVGSKQICMLDDEYNLKCKTRAFSERLVPPEDTPELVSIAAGDSHLCGLTSSGRIQCFGDNDFGQTSHESVTLDNQYREIQSGGNHSCATRVSGVEVDCWGGDTNQLTVGISDYISNWSGSVSEVDNIDQLVLGSRNICWVAELSSNRTNLVCWENGRDFYFILEVFGGYIDAASSDDEIHCPITSSGRVICLKDIGWARKFQSTSFELSEPYSQVAVSGSVVCVLTSTGRLSCDTSILEGDSPGRYEQRNAATINEQVRALSDKRFTHLEPFPAYFGNGGIGFCLADTRDELHCIGEVYESLNSAEPDTDWIDSGFTDEDYRNSLLDITNIAVYGHSIVELFWEPSVQFTSYSHIEIFRNDTLLTSTTNASSFFDSTLEGGETYSYKIREVSIDGTAGEFSNAFTVTTPPQNMTSAGPIEPSNGCDADTLASPLVLEVLRYGNNSGELFWLRDAYDPQINVAYNLFVNGVQINSEPLDNNGSYYLYGDDLYNDSYSYSLNAVDGCGRTSELSNEVSP